MRHHNVHGSVICWNKFISGGKFYKADTILSGGDMTSKAIVLIIIYKQIPVE